MPSRDETTFDHARAGGVYVDSASGAVTGRFYGYLIINDAVLSAVSARGNAVTGLSKLVGRTLVAGLYDPVQLSGMTVTSGLVKLLTEPS